MWRRMVEKMGSKWPENLEKNEGKSGRKSRCRRRKKLVKKRSNKWEKNG